jgi:2'-5' RNA ligase
MSETALQVQVRVFVAIELPQTVIDALVAVQGQLQATGLPLRYAGGAGLHLTLAFIGEIPAPQVEPLTSAVQRGSAGVAAFDLRAEGMGMFPNARAPRVVWAGVEGAPAAMAALTQLHQGIVRELVGAHFPVDRSFDPHLTLARTRDRVSPAERGQIGAAVQALPPLSPVPFHVNAVTVMHSQMQSGGSVYTPLAHIMLVSAERH